MIHERKNNDGKFPKERDTFAAGKFNKEAPKERELRLQVYQVQREQRRRSIKFYMYQVNKTSEIFDLDRDQFVDEIYNGEC